MPEAFRHDRHIILVPVADRADGETRLSRHQISLLVDAKSPSHAYWLNDSSPDGSLAERIYLASFMIGKPVPEKASPSEDRSAISTG